MVGNIFFQLDKSKGGLEEDVFGRGPLIHLIYLSRSGSIKFCAKATYVQAFIIQIPIKLNYV